MTAPTQPEKPPSGARSPVKYGSSVAAAVLVLAASTAVNYALARRAERRNPPQGRFVTADGVRLHYLDRGSGPDIAVLHGLGSLTTEMMASGIVDSLAADHRVIVFDRPGFGYSERPRGRIWTPAAQAALLRQALDKLGVGRPVIVGHSWGALVALEMALRDPDRIAGLVLLGGYYFPTPRLDVLLAFWPAVPVLGDILRYTISPWLGRLSKPLLYKWLFAPAPVTQSFADAFPSGMIFRPWHLRSAAAEAALAIPGAAALSGRYRHLRLPTAIVGGSGDRIVNFERHSSRLYNIVPSSTLRTLPRTGHMVHHNAPEQVTAVIREMVRATYAKTAGTGR
ncbi:MAG: alpha/beta fold hydrolase [Alphaproteobacteria bacterium]